TRAVEHCWQVNREIYLSDAPANYERNRIDMGATVYQAIRNDDHKLERNWALDYFPATDSGEGVTTEEFDEINQSREPAQLKLDRAGADLLARHLPLTAAQQTHHAELSSRLDAILASQRACPGDGDSNGVVDHVDIAHFQRISTEWGLSSVYDFNHDG